LAAWLADGGDLEREHLVVSAIPGSHATPRHIALRLQASTVTDGAAAKETKRFPSSRGQQKTEDAGTVKP
jgi:hypothetical protein